MPSFAWISKQWNFLHSSHSSYWSLYSLPANRPKLHRLNFQMVPIKGRLTQKAENMVKERMNGMMALSMWETSSMTQGTGMVALIGAMENHTRENIWKTKEPVKVPTIGLMVLTTKDLFWEGNDTVRVLTTRLVEQFTKESGSMTYSMGKENLITQISLWFGGFGKMVR